MKNFKHFRIYTAIFTSLLIIGAFAYKDTILENKKAVSEVADVPKRGDDPDSASKYHILDLQLITCNTTADSAPSNMVKITVYTDKSNTQNASQPLTWGPEELAPANSKAVNINVEFEDKVDIKLSYTDNNGAEKVIGRRPLNRLNRKDLNFVNLGNSANYSLSYSIRAANNASE